MRWANLYAFSAITAKPPPQLAGLHDGVEGQQVRLEDNIVDGLDEQLSSSRWRR
jgi:hypothetical protein